MSTSAERNLRTAQALLSRDGWAYASSLPIDAADPGRFHCLFGRDSLIFALQVLPVMPEVATATLRALAARQGRLDDPDTEEQPGRILHEFREQAPPDLIAAGWPVRDGQLCYYGTSDATSWFLVLLATTGDIALQAELASNVADAAAWLQGALDRGAGFLRCGPRSYPGGLSQQGWRDAGDPAPPTNGGGIVDAYCRTPPAPLADADSQAAAVAALDALVLLQPHRAEHWRREAADLRARIEAVFTPEVMALDGDDRPVPGAGSQLGWLLWADALSVDAAAAAAERLTRPDILTRFGVRTLSSEQPHFRLDGYHRGAIWPFDSWFSWAGLRRAGHPRHEDVRAGVREALARLGHYPELYGVDDGEVYRLPASNQVQAWTVGATVAFDHDWGGRRPP